MRLPYVPPRSALDPPTPELVILFLEGVARSTDAFQELRHDILPKWHEPQWPLDAMKAWLAKWRLSAFENYELNEMIHSWIFEILDQWQRDPDAAAGLMVDNDFWKRRATANYGDSPTICAYNMEREPLTNWVQRVIKTQKYLQRERRERFSLVEYTRRDSGRPAEWDFEWLAMHHCKGYSYQRIANMPKFRGRATQEVVKKACQKLAEQLKMGK